MGEALITRRGGGGSLTKSTDISDSIIKNGGSAYENWYAVCVIDPNKTYLATIRSRNSSDDSTGTVTLVISKGEVICESGSAGCVWGVNFEKNWIYADDDSEQGTLYKFYVYLLE